MTAFLTDMLATAFGCALFVGIVWLVIQMQGRGEG